MVPMSNKSSRCLPGSGLKHTESGEIFMPEVTVVTCFDWLCYSKELLLRVFLYLKGV